MYGLQTNTWRSPKRSRGDRHALVPRETVTSCYAHALHSLDRHNEFVEVIHLGLTQRTLNI